MWGSTTSPRPTGLGMWLFGHRLLLNVPDLLLMSVKGGLSLKHVVLRPGGLVLVPFDPLFHRSCTSTLGIIPGRWITEHLLELMLSCGVL